LSNRRIQKLEAFVAVGFPRDIMENPEGISVMHSIMVVAWVLYDFLRGPPPGYFCSSLVVVGARRLFRGHTNNAACTPPPGGIMWVHLLLGLDGKSRKS